MVVALGSMAIKGVFKAGSLLSGLGKTAGKLKEVKQRGKSTTTEMKRMTGQTNLLRKAMAAIGIAGFSALLMTTPQLAGSLAKIKHEMTMLAWSIGKHLKPALDAVAMILRGIRTGDWATVKQGIEDLTESVVNLIAKAGTYVIDLIFGEGTAAQCYKDFLNWWENLNAAYEEGNLGKFVWTLVAEPIMWAVDRISNWLGNVAAYVKTSKGRKELLDALAITSPYVKLAKGAYDFAKGWGRGKEQAEDYGGYAYQTGGHVPRTGMYKLHAGETVTMQGSAPGGAAGGSTSITLDFSGANINLAGGIELNDFAEVISNKIAERQHSMTY